MSTTLKTLAAVVLTTLAFAAFAQTTAEEEAAAEEERRQTFVNGMTLVVDTLNRGSFDAFVRAINRDDFLERVFGLRLIDGKIKNDFREDMQDGRKWSAFVESLLAEEAEKGIKATLLAVESRGDRGRAVVRYDMSFFRATYHEYDLQLDKNGHMNIVDWYDYRWGHRFTDRMGLTLVQARPNENAARKLVNLPNIRETEIFQVMETLKATRDRNFRRYEEIQEAMPERLKSQRIIVQLGLDTARAARNRRAQRAALERVAQYYPDDPLFALSLMDYYLPEERYQDALDTLNALHKHLRVDDPLLNARISSVLLAMEKTVEAETLAMKSITQDPALELGWWSVLRARVTAENYAGALEALEILEDGFGHSLGPDELSKDPMFRPFMLSAEYRTWFEESD